MGTVAGHRGAAGELTVRVPAGDASFWQDLPRVRVGDRLYDVEHGRAYRDRLVLKLAGVDDPGAAERLRGALVTAAEQDAPQLEAGAHYVAGLVGMDVEDEQGDVVGRVRDVMPTAGGDLLVVVPEGGAATDEMLIPMAREIVLEVNDDRRRIRIRPPAGLLELNRG